MADVHDVTETTAELQEQNYIKRAKCADKNRIDVICPLHQHDACQSRLKHLDQRKHDDNRRQVIPYLNCCRKKLCLKASTSPIVCSTCCYVLSCSAYLES